MRTRPTPSAVSGLLLLAALPAVASAPPTLPTTGRSAAAFAPPGWRVLHSATGDLDRDGAPDLAVALGSGKEQTDDPTSVIDGLPRRLLVVAWGAKGGGGGGYRRAVVDDVALLGRFEGGVFGDPLADLRIERGALVVEHYGGSRDRWAYTDRYRWQNGGFELIGATYTATDTLDPDFDSTIDLNLSTGLTEERQRGRRPDGGPGPFRAGYHQLRVAPVAAVTPLSDAPLARPAVRLRSREDVVRGARDWEGEADLSATLSAAVSGDSLYLRAVVRDDRVLPGDAVQWVDGKGRVVKPAEAITRPFPSGYRWQARYTAASLGLSKGTAVGGRPGAPPVWGTSVPADPGAAGQVNPVLRASVEVIDSDTPGAAKSALSTARTPGRRRAGLVRFADRPGVPRLGDGSAAPGAASVPLE